MITRTPAPPETACARINSLAALLDVLRLHANPELPLFISDLSLGAWRGNQVASEYLLQLGKQESHESKADAENAHAGIGYWIDAENRGGVSSIKALELADEVLEYAPDEGAVFVVIAPRFGCGWGEDNERFIAALSRGAAGKDCQLIIALGEGAENFPAGISPVIIETPQCEKSEPHNPEGTELFNALPGVITPDIAEALTNARFDGAALANAVYGLGLSGDCYLIPLENRIAPSARPSAVYKALSLAVKNIGWLAAYTQHCVSTGHPDYDLLIEQSWARLKEGGGEISARLMDRAMQSAPDEFSRAEFESQRQWMRIATHKFAEAGESPDPPEGLERELAGTLYWQKGWGLIMSGDAVRAAPCFEKALAALDFAETKVELVYLLNIYALSRIRLGDLDGALKLERRIEKIFESRLVDDWHMRYINFLNLARLMRKAGDLNAAEDYYAKAFHAADGAKNEVDGFYINACMALTASAKEDFHGAFIYWMRAALHFAALSYPEAIGWRITETIRAGVEETGGRTQSAGCIPEDMASQLCTLLTHYSILAGFEEAFAVISVAGDSAAMVFRNYESYRNENAGAAELDAYGAGGWGILYSQAVASVPFEGPNHRKLRNALVSLIKIFCPPFAYASSGGTVIVDDLHGEDMPEDFKRYLDMAALRGAGKVVYQDSAIQQDAGRINAMDAALNPAVKSLSSKDGSLKITFKRYFEPVTVTGDEKQIVVEIAAHRAGVTVKRLAESNGGSDVIATLRKLYAMKIIRLSTKFIQDKTADSGITTSKYAERSIKAGSTLE